MNDSLQLEVAKVTPPVGVVVYEKLTQITLSDVVLWLTAIYTALLIIGWIRKYLKSRRLADSDPICAEDCPVAKRLIEERDEAVKP